MEIHHSTFVPGTKIFSCLGGSYLYGTNTPTSDRDFKKIVIPEAGDILLQRAGWKSKHRKTNKNHNREKNKAKDVDIEVFSYKGYIDLLLEGQTVAVEMLFAPPEAIIYSSLYWEFILENKDKLLHSGTLQYVGYCRTQAKKYSVKGDRIISCRAAIELLETMHPYTKLLEYKGTLEALASGYEFVEIITQEGKRGPEDFFEVCNRKIPLTAKVNKALELCRSINEEYGKRANAAAEMGGNDWKALMHAVRVCKQAEELLLTSNITLPLPSKDLLLSIRNGEMKYEEVDEIITDGLMRVEKAVKITTLPKEPNYIFWEEDIKRVYRSIWKT